MSKVLLFGRKNKHQQLIDAKKNNPALKIQWELNGVWIDTDNPTWKQNMNYRVKPDQVLRYRKYLNKYGKEILVGVDASGWSDFVKWIDDDWQEMKVD